ncbi:uncharacterized protein LOC110033290 isoform X2 [Phalaenopsis equestris]|uniref:uncharacterized protein LOC110033290 isoform X2 n=1 Tax=Phalaenopsis equestris TaxID=78828 RepID=UPI0009E2F514|nr:uncharacterized protein LOC110033290 isoform X2 [Phalaenopsis equestris]
MAPSKWRPWRILARAKAKGVDLMLNAAIEGAPLNSLNVRKRFFLLLGLQRFFIAVKLETYDFEPKGTFKKSKILQLLGKIFVRRRKMRWIRDNAGAQKSSKLWLPYLASLQILSSKISPSNWSWTIWPAIFILSLLFFCERI